MDPHTEHPFALFKLPLELRLNIYELVGRPLFSPPSEYAGLYFSCERVQKELDGELLRAALQTLNNIQEALPLPWKITFAAKARKYHELTCIALVFPRDFLRQDSDYYIEMLSSLECLTSLHFNTVTFRVCEGGRPAHGRVPGVFDFRHSDDDLAIDEGSQHHETTEPEHSQNRTRYQAATNYGDIAMFAKCLICFVCPRICRDERHPFYQSFCSYWYDDRLLDPDAEFNFRNVVLEFGILDPIANSRGIDFWKAGPLCETSTLKRLGWRIEADFERDSDGKFDMSRPVRFTWKRVKVGKTKRAVNRVMYASKGRWLKLVHRIIIMTW